MRVVPEVHSSNFWNDPFSYLQVVTRRISIISALFTTMASVLSSGPNWRLAAGLSGIYVIYNVVLCIRRTKPQLVELIVCLSLCAGLTLCGAVYSNVLYYLLLIRMVLKVGRDRARRMSIAVMSVYLIASISRPELTFLPYFLEMLYNVTGLACLTYTAVYMRTIVEQQAKSEGEIAELMRENARHYHMAHTDVLTGLLNHRSYIEKTAHLSEYVLLIIDIDHFKILNDRYGHLFGDQVLTTIGDIIKLSIRNQDMAFRYGGEEFAVLLPGTSLEIGLKIAERLRDQVEGSEFYHKGERVKITISIGLSQKHASEASQDAFSEADSALYRAKQQGRNQCAVF